MECVAPEVLCFRRFSKVGNEQFSGSYNVTPSHYPDSSRVNVEKFRLDDTL